MPPAIDPPPPNHDNHDVPTAANQAPPATPPLQQHALPHPPKNNTTWAEIAKTKHPNPQHVPYSEGRGPSSKRRYRKRATRRHILTTNTLSLLASSLSTSLPSTGTHTPPNVIEQSKNILRKIHKKHNNVLIPHTTKHDDDHQKQYPNIALQIEQELNAIKTLSNTFDTTASRLESSLNDDDNTVATQSHNNITSRLDHEILLPIEATLQLALDDFARYTNNPHHNKYTEYQTTFDNSDDNISLYSDIDADTSELEALYTQQNNDINTPPKLTDLLLHYERILPTTTSTTKTLPLFSILPPWEDIITNATNENQHTSNNSSAQMQSPLPILPPRTNVLPRPDNQEPPSWTTDHPSWTHPTLTTRANTNTLYQPTHDIEFDTMEYEPYKHSQQSQPEPTDRNIDYNNIDYNIEQPMQNNKLPPSNNTIRPKHQRRRRKQQTTISNLHNRN
jgi:hypothetical protein